MGEDEVAISESLMPVKAAAAADRTFSHAVTLASSPAGSVVGAMTATKAAGAVTPISTKTIRFLPCPFDVPRSTLCVHGHLLNERAHVEELIARDHAVLHRVECEFFVREARAANFGGEVDRAVDGNPMQAPN